MALSDRLPTPLWMEGYDSARLGADLLAGVILAVLLVPQAVAYAQLAGLPPETGLYTAIAPALLYLFFGTSPSVSMGPVALASLLVGEAIADAAIPATEAAAIIAIETGIMLTLLGMLRLGRLVNFVSEPALLGFTAAAAVLIATSQLPALLGIDVGRAGNLVESTAHIAPAIDNLNGAALAVGGAALAILILADRFAAAGLWKLGLHPPWRQAIVKAIPLVVLVGASLIAFSGVDIETVGRTSAGFPTPTLPTADLDAWIRLLPSSGVVALVVFVVGVAVAKALAGRERQALDTSREAFAIGVANLGAGLTGGYAAGVSLSRSALVYDAGGRSPIASASAALIVLAVAVFLSSALAYLPNTVLAALVISAVFGLVKTREIHSIWVHSKVEFGVFLAALVATLVFGVQWGLAIGAGLGLFAYLWFSSVPRVTRVGTVEGSDWAFRSIDRDEVKVDTLPVLVVRVDRSLYFGNAAYCEDRILHFIAQHPEASCLILDMRAVNTIDASGVAMIERLLDNLDEKQLSVDFACAHQPVYEALQRNPTARSREFYTTVADGVEQCRDKVTCEVD